VTPEIASGEVVWADGARASTRPAYVTPEIDQRGVVALVADDASTRPAYVTPEIAERSPRRAWASQCFNEAGVRDAGDLACARGSPWE